MVVTEATLKNKGSEVRGVWSTTGHFGYFGSRGLIQISELYLCLSFKASKGMNEMTIVNPLVQCSQIIHI